jgi:hypothetical protein
LGGVWLPNARFASAPDTPCSWLPDEFLLSKAGWQDKFADVAGARSQRNHCPIRAPTSRSRVDLALMNNGYTINGAYQLRLAP